MKGMNGVVESSVSIMTHQGKVVVDDAVPNAVGPRDIMNKVKDLGYDCQLIVGESLSENSSKNIRNGNVNGDISAQCDAELLEWKRLLIFALVLGIPVLLLHLFSHSNEMLMMFMSESAICGNGVQMGQLIMLSLNFPLLCIVGFKFYRAALIGAYHGSLGMDFLVMTGTSITFLYSIIKLFYACGSGIPTNHIFFETTGMLLMFVTIGKYIEAYAKGKSASSIAELLQLQPREAFLVTGTSFVEVFSF